MTMPQKSKPKGGPGGPGRPKGCPNKLTTELKAMIMGALAECGGVEYLKVQAVENPSAFLRLVGQLIPYVIKGEGDNGQIIVEIVKFGAGP